MASPSPEKFSTACFKAMDTNLKGKLQGEYQQQGVEWMLHREYPLNSVRGGFLCDDMGMGKTNQCVALMAAHELTKPTLIITLVGTVKHWKDTLKDFGGINPVVLKPNFKGSIPKNTKAVLIPYSVLQYYRSDEIPTMLNIKWGRIILDEGHIIRNAKTKLSKMINQLQKDIMWVLTATPIQNSINDLLNMAATIGIPTKDTDAITDKYYLRRTQDDEGKKNPALALPALSTKVVKIPFSDAAERALYDAVHDIFMERLEAVEGNGAKFRNTAIEGLVRLRQVCAHPFVFFKAITEKIGKKKIQALKRAGVKRRFIDDSDTDDESDTESDVSNLIGSDDEDDPDNVPLSKRMALTGTSGEENAKPVRAPSAYFKPIKALDKDDVDDMEVVEDLVKYLIKKGIDITTHENMYGSKIDYLITDLQLHRGAKSLVFCSFIEEMHLITHLLAQNDISFECFDGSMGQNEKDNAIENFQTTEIEVMVLQVKCGSTGLNLQAASRVYIMTPNYNPCVDIQAVGRSHRKGQSNPVECIRLVIEKTVDERCLAISNDKLMIITNALKDDNYNAKLGAVMPTAAGELTNADLKSIFG